MKKIIKEINHEYEPGVGAEINSFMTYQKENINDYQLSFNENEEYFSLTITLANLNKMAVKQLFFQLMLFIEYSHATFYTFNQVAGEISYEVTSYNIDKKGFLLKIKFSSLN
ncbi:hypothetical protein [Enterococcus ureasiticus]|uniref:hypothetical protein n=1 Tax=Enterococcus ureasiticus TaxID=903984 RepID=UPI001112E824|nr:hypothetical protein [Enterococcus ureasiticus]